MPISMKRGLDSLNIPNALVDFTALLPSRFVRGRMGVAADRAMFLASSAMINRQLRGAVEGFRPNVVIVSKGLHIWPSTLRWMRARDIWLGNWNPDDFRNPLNATHFSRESMKEYDVLFTHRRHLLDTYRAMGGRRVEHIALCYDPVVHFPASLTPQERADWGSDLSFIGSWSRRREKLLQGRGNLHYRIWGSSWHHASAEFRAAGHRIEGRRVHDGELRSAYAATKLTVNILTIENADLINLRNFEAAACGVAQLAERSPEVSEMFNDGVDIALFATPEELEEKALFYLNHDDARVRLAQQGRASVVAGNHTYANRMKRILDIALER
jgi:spore maturation protein CgeB